MRPQHDYSVVHFAANLYQVRVFMYYTEALYGFCFVCVHMHLYDTSTYHTDKQCLNVLFLCAYTMEILISASLVRTKIPVHCDTFWTGEHASTAALTSEPVRSPTTGFWAKTAWAGGGGRRVKQSTKPTMGMQEAVRDLGDLRISLGTSPRSSLEAVQQKAGIGHTDWEEMPIIFRIITGSAKEEM